MAKYNKLPEILKRDTQFYSWLLEYRTSKNYNIVKGEDPLAAFIKFWFNTNNVMFVGTALTIYPPTKDNVIRSNYKMPMWMESYRKKILPKLTDNVDSNVEHAISALS